MAVPRILGAGVFVLMLLMVTACGGDASPAREARDMPVAPGRIHCALPDGPIGIAASTRANAPALEVTPSVAAVLQHAVDNEQYVALFDTDGAPSKVDELSLRSGAKNPQARQAEVSNQLAQLQRGLQSSQADAREADPLGALDLAVRSVRARADRGTVVLIDSGLQTTGALRFQEEELLLASGQDLVGFLRSTGQLPDLHGMTVVLSGIGDTARPQARLDAASRNRLVEQWSAIAEASGAACVHIDPHPMTHVGGAALPHVSAVTVPKPPSPELDLQRPVALREDSVGFEDNSAELRNPALARQVLKTIADAIIRGKHHVSLIGTTATAGTEHGRRELSLLRAEAVKRLLVNLGVSASHIKTRGVGSQHPEHVKDLDEQGNLIPEAAVQNRAVFLSVTR